MQCFVLIKQLDSPRQCQFQVRHLSPPDLTQESQLGQSTADSFSISPQPRREREKNPLLSLTTAGPGWIQSLQVSAQETQHLEPILSQSYRSILPTSLTCIVLSISGCSSWRPAVVMSTTRLKNHRLPWIFKGLESTPDTTRGVVLYLTLNPTSRQSNFRVKVR